MITLWTDVEIQILINTYEISTYNEMLIIFPNRSYPSIFMKANKLGLKKNKAIRSAHIAKRNKMVGRDLSLHNLREIALKYKTRGEFQNKDGSAYVVARIHGWLNEICKHMIPQKYSTPQLILNQLLENLLNVKSSYNNRKILKPYEIDIYFDCYKLGFEYDGIIWHSGKFGNKINKEDLAAKNGIKIFTFKEGDKSKYEEEIKNHLKKIISEINSITGLSILAEDIDGVIIDYEKLILDIKDVEKICNQYYDKRQFKKEHPTIYERLRKMKLIDKFTKHMKSYKIPWTETRIKDELSKYEWINDVVLNSFGCYCYCKRHKLNNLLSHLKYKDRSLIQKGRSVSKETKDKISKTLMGNNNAKKKLSKI
jgi:hypothetical protein